MTKQQIVLSVSAGTGLLAIVMCIGISVAIVLSGCESHASYDPSQPFIPSTGMIGEMKRQANDVKYGPVNHEAAEEIKDGLFDRIRQRRAARQGQACTHVQRVQQAACPPGYQTVPVCRPIESTTFVTSTSVASTQTRVNEYPKVSPLTKPDCASGRCSNPDPDIAKLFSADQSQANRRSEMKTGAFRCSQCGNPSVGDEWHTDWTADGTPITFLCESCYGRMSPDQRVAAYQRYAGRQLSKSGQVGLLHPETSR